MIIDEEYWPGPTFHLTGPKVEGLKESFEALKKAFEESGRPFVELTETMRKIGPLPSMHHHTTSKPKFSPIPTFIVPKEISEKYKDMDLTSIKMVPPEPPEPRKIPPRKGQTGPRPKRHFDRRGNKTF